MLQNCSLTWEMGCNFLNHSRREKNRKSGTEWKAEQRLQEKKRGERKKARQREKKRVKVTKRAAS